MDYQNQPVDPELVVQKLEEHGKLVGGKAYGHWSKYPATMFSFSRHGIELIEMPEDGFGNKKGNDIKLAVDAIETMFSLPHIETFVLVTGDADFVPLVKKLRTYGKTVYVIGRSKNTSPDMQFAADTYIPYEEIVKSEKVNSTDSFEDLVDEMIRIMDEKSLQPDETVVKRIVTGMGVYYGNFGYKTMGDFVEGLLKNIRKKMFKESYEYSEYEENYMRFLERLVATSNTPFDVEKLEKIAKSRHQWISKNSNLDSLENFIQNMIGSGKLKETKDKFLYVPAPRRWEIKYDKILPYPELRAEFGKHVYELFMKRKVSTISEALHVSKENLNLTNKVIGSFGIALKFSGMFIGKDGSDYVSLKTPVKLNGTYEEFKLTLDTFYVKRILKDENINEGQLDKVSIHVFNDKDHEKTKKVLDFMIKTKDVFYEKPYYKYKDKK
ncbi:MAG: hypothetical protein PWP28_550 [Oceanotoga sp.]|jgi:hypothetical protein|nr:hypothetical protein [Oceanotoga sp.]MDO7977429.1 NYN domain-containing protein [Oceanotoga teriensis]